MKVICVDNYKKVVNKTFLLNHNSNTTILIQRILSFFGQILYL